jgi:hypothetical protein
MNRFPIFYSCIVLILFTGCANHIKNVAVKDTRIERKIKKEDYFITLASKNKVIQNPEINITIEKLVKRQVTHYEITQGKELFTPYQGWRESYEIPMGVGLFPCALAVSAADFASLGFIPNRFTDDLLDYSFTAMNPCLNIEDEKRVLLKNRKLEKRKIDTRNEVIKLPVAGIKVKLCSVNSNKPLLMIKTSTDGRAEINFLHKKLLKSDFHSQREFALIVVNNKGKTVARTQLLLDRLLSIKLKKAIKIIGKFHANETPKGLAETIWELEKLKFPKVALNLEKKCLVDHAKDKAFSSRFATAMASMAPLSSTTLKKRKKIYSK